MFFLVDSALGAVEFTTEKATLDVDYKLFNDNNQKIITVSTSSFVLRNTDAVNSAVVTLTVTGLPTNYAVRSQEVTIPAAGTLSATLSLDVPHKEDAGNKNIGTITASQGSNQLASLPLEQKTKSMLSLKDFNVDYIDQGDSSEKDSFDTDEDQFELEKEVLVGTTVTLNFKFENLFDNDYDSDDGKIDDINLKIEADDNDLFADDFEEDYDIGSIANDGTKDYEVSFIIGDEANARDYTLTITLDGEDGKGARHEIEKELEFSVIRKRNDVRFEKANLTTTTDITTCSPRFMMEVKMRNYGTKNQNDAALSIYNADLNINENVPHIALESFGENDDTWSRTFNFNPTNLKAGSYYLDVTAYIDNDLSADHERVPVVVKACKAEKKTEVVNKTETVAPEPKVVEQPKANETVTTMPVIKTVEKSFTTDDLIVGGAVIIMVLLISIIGLFAAILIKK